MSHIDQIFDRSYHFLTISELINGHDGHMKFPHRIYCSNLLIYFKVVYCGGREFTGMYLAMQTSTPQTVKRNDIAYVIDQQAALEVHGINIFLNADKMISETNISAKNGENCGIE